YPKNSHPDWLGILRPGQTAPDWHRMRFPFAERLNGPVYAFLYQDDGTLVVGGDFTMVGETPINRIARWNGATWTGFGSGMNAAVRALAFLPDSGTGEKRLVAGGEFTTAGGSTRNRIALWSGSAWQAMNSGMNDTVHALAFSAMDGLVAGGEFTTAGTHGCLHVAAWTGTNWINPGGLTGTDGPVYALLYNPSDGSTVAGGNFSTADGSGNPCANIAMLDTGNTGMWLPMDLGTYGRVFALARRSSGLVIAGGDFYAAGSGPSADTAGLAGFNGSTWVSIAGGTGGTVRAIAVKPNGDLAIGGNFSSVGVGGGAVSATNVAILTGSTWSPLTSGVTNASGSTASCFALAWNVNELQVGGSFDRAGGKPVRNFSRWTQDDAPVIKRQPNAGACPTSATITISVITAPGYEPITYQWKRDGVAVTDGPQGASSLGGTVSGSTTDTLTIASFNYHDRGGYTVTISNACGSVDSAVCSAGLGCAADFNADCVLEVQDIFDFLNAWLAGDPAADFNQSGITNPPPNGLSVQDIFDFLNAWFVGCY
ncbi:MAG TPA: GC-type dockerin domain-anchored protein, partial [Phycisphaerales bacterium]|nr:GC-type dockerin domain-anchored protein [Phycisphaerales bacterium]